MLSFLLRICRWITRKSTAWVSFHLFSSKKSKITQIQLYLLFYLLKLLNLVITSAVFWVLRALKFPGKLHKNPRRSGRVIYFNHHRTKEQEEIEIRSSAVNLKRACLRETIHTLFLINLNRRKEKVSVQLSEKEREKDREVKNNLSISRCVQYGWFMRATKLCKNSACRIATASKRERVFRFAAKRAIFSDVLWIKTFRLKY